MSKEQANALDTHPSLMLNSPGPDGLPAEWTLLANSISFITQSC